MLSPDPAPFKANDGQALPRRLSGHSLLEFSGPEASAFLQAQLMNDVRALEPGRWQWSGWLNPKGRVICLFALWRRAEQEFVALLPDFPAAELQPLLQRYVFRSKLRIGVGEDLVVAGAFAGHASGEAASNLAQSRDGGWRFDLSGAGAARELWLLPDAALADAQAGFDAEWRDADLAHGLPRLDAGQREAWTPQMLSLQRLGAFSLAKGCYPGQEIVARTHFLGQAKRELVRLQGEAPSVGASVAGEDGRALGTVVAAGRREALAVLPVERPQRLFADGRELASPALFEGLQRPL